MKNKWILAASAVIGLGMSVQANTVTWNSFGSGDLGAGPTTFTSGVYGLTASGYSTGGASINLFGKTGGGDETGLGLVGTLDNEITASTFIQISSTITGVPTALLTSIIFGSTTGGEIGNIYGSNVNGILGGVLIGSKNSDGSITISNPTAFTYFDVIASGPTSANVLIDSITGSFTTSVPDGGTTVMFLGCALVGMALFRKKVIA